MIFVVFFCWAVYKLCKKLLNLGLMFPVAYVINSCRSLIINELLYICCGFEFLCNTFLIKFLLDSGADVNSNGFLGLRALFNRFVDGSFHDWDPREWPVYNPTHKVIAYAKSARVFELFKSHGANFRVPYCNGYTLMHLAAYYHNPVAIDFLARNGLSVNDQANPSRLTPHMFMTMAWLRKGTGTPETSPTALALQERGVDFNLRDIKGNNVLHIAIYCFAKTYVSSDPLHHTNPFPDGGPKLDRRRGEAILKFWIQIALLGGVGLNDCNDSRETLLSLWRKLKPMRFGPESAGYMEIEGLLTHGPSGARFGPPQPDPPSPAQPRP